MIITCKNLGIQGNSAKSINNPMSSFGLSAETTRKTSLDCTKNQIMQSFIYSSQAQSVVFVSFIPFSPFVELLYIVQPIKVQHTSAALLSFTYVDYETEMYFFSLSNRSEVLVFLVTLKTKTIKVKYIMYSHLFNKRGRGAKIAKSLNVEGGIFWKKLVHNSNKRGVEGGKI